MKRRLIAAALLLAAAAASATEGGGNSYPIGVETQGVGFMLPEGAHWFAYLQYYDAGRLKDNAGRDSANVTSFHLVSEVAALRLSYVWPGVRLFGANVETRVVQPLAAVKLSLGIARPSPLDPLDRSGEHTGLADTAFVPLILGWHGSTLHQTVGLDSHLPLGDYEASRRVNTGRNYWQVAPFYAFTWFPRTGWDLSAKLRYAVNSSNQATHYRSGDEVTLEFGGGYRFSPAWAAGLSGYLYRQVTDDVQNGAPVNGNGNRGRVNALGPSLAYSFSPAVAVLLKLQHEWDARNRPQGNRAWLQLRIPF